LRFYAQGSNFGMILPLFNVMEVNYGTLKK
jgi:hypothetical protein